MALGIAWPRSASPYAFASSMLPERSTRTTPENPVRSARESTASSKGSILLTARRLVRHAHHPGAEGRRIHEFQTHLLGHLVEEAHPGAEHDRVNHEAELIEHPVAQERTHEPGAAGDVDVLAGLPLELREFLGEVSLDQRRVLPLKRLFQGRRRDVLGRVVHVVGQWDVTALLR